MASKSTNLLLSFLPIFLFSRLLHPSIAQPDTNGYTCSSSTTTNSTSKAPYPCRTYVHYLAQAPDRLDLAAIGDLFSVSRLMISQPSNISSLNSSLVPGESLFVPISCGCYPVNDSASLSYANLTYRIKEGDTFYIGSTTYYENLTTYQSVEVVNPTLVPTNLSIGADVIFPIFCKCPDNARLGKGTNFIVSYVFQPGNKLSYIAHTFGTTIDSIIAVNGKSSFGDYDTVFVPVSKLPQLNQPSPLPPAGNVVPPAGDVVPPAEVKRKGSVAAMAIGLGVCVCLLVCVVVFWIFREIWVRKRGRDVEEQRNQMPRKVGKGYLKEFEGNFLADVSETLDKYKVYEIEQLRKATDEFDDKSVIDGSVYKGCINGEVFAVKRMKWNAYEELKILQKVNHGNLVRLEGFCIDPVDATCYLVYEYVENGSLDSWLHESKKGKLNWKARMQIAIDVANGLQYIHEHTRPQVVHKDIKSSNILLDSKMRAKIANFGLARSGCNAITMHIVGTQGYMAPEHLADGIISTKLDVFSFGVVLLEMISGRKAIDDEGNVLWMGIENGLDLNDNKAKNLMEWVDRVLLMDSVSMDSLMNVLTIAIACVNRNPAERPSMVDIVYALSKYQDMLYDMSEGGPAPPVVAR